MDVPILSIIIPVYNTQLYISKCIDSIINNKDYTFEIILIDDGSTDCSGNICDEYAKRDKRIRVIHKKNEGVSVARNIGIDVARGEYYTFVDSDDIVSEDYIESIFSKINESNTDLLFFSSQFFYEDNSKKSNILYNTSVNSTKDIQKVICFLKNNQQNFEFFGYTWNKVFKSSIIKKNGIRFIEGLDYREDEVFTWQYIKYINNIQTTSNILYYYRNNNAGLTHRKKSRSKYLLLINSLLDNRPPFIDDKQLLFTCDKQILKYYAWALATRGKNSFSLIKKTNKLINKRFVNCKRKMTLFFIFNFLKQIQNNSSDD